MASYKMVKYYWGVAIPQIKDRLNQLKVCPFLLDETDTHVLVKGITKTKTTAGLTNTDFLLFLEKVWCWGAHLGIYISNPNEITMEKLLSKVNTLIFKNRHKGEFTITFRTGTPIIDFTHFMDRTRCKNINSYYEGPLTDFSNEFGCIPLESFLSEVTNYINSL